MFYSLKQRIPWQTPSDKKFNLYSSLVLSVLLYGIPSWSPNITRLKSLENFQKQCFRWIFGTNTSYQELLRNHSILPICHLIELRTFIFLAQLMNNKYQFDYKKFLVVNDPTNQRRICSFNFFKTDSLSANLNSFFTRSATMVNYLFRHKVISGFKKSDETAVKKYLLNKPFSVDIICTYYIVCTCSNCFMLKSIC